MKYKVFVSFVNQDNKRIWKLFNAASIQSATARIDLIAAQNIVSYVRIERL